MALVIENGSGVTGANSYVAATYVTTYLTDRNRATEGGWTSPEGTEEDAACIAATDYIEIRFRHLFRGQKEHRNINLARSTLTFTAQPTATETVAVGSQTYTFVSALASADDVLIGTTLAESIVHLVAAINADSSESGSGYHADTAENADATAEEFIGDTMVVKATTTGTGGNGVATTTTVTGATWNFATTVGGSDIVVPQPLSFPREDLFDADGISIVGIPERLKYATAEYAVRARAAALAPDPSMETTLIPVIGERVKVGSVESETTYGQGGQPVITKPYPAADLLLREFIGSGGVTR